MQRFGKEFNGACVLVFAQGVGSNVSTAGGFFFVYLWNGQTKRLVCFSVTFRRLTTHSAWKYVKYCNHYLQAHLHQLIYIEISRLWYARPVWNEIRQWALCSTDVCVAVGARHFWVALINVSRETTLFSKRHQPCSKEASVPSLYVACVEQF